MSTKIAVDELHDRIRKAVTGFSGDYTIHCLVECRSEQPDGKLFPPTYAKPEGDKSEGKIRYHIEERLYRGEKRLIVVVNGVAAYANGLEGGMLDLYQAGDDAPELLGLSPLRIPHLEVFVAAEDRWLSILECPHRAFDSIVRDSHYNGVPFSECSLVTDRNGPAYGLFDRNISNALKALLRVAPVTAALGGWCSTHLKNRGIKLARSAHGEITAGLVSRTLKSASRIDPLGLEKQPYIYNEANRTQWELVNEDYDKKLLPPGWKFEDKLSEINHGNVTPTVSDGGVCVDWIHDNFYIALQGFTNFRTGDIKYDLKARTYLCAITLLMHALRSGRYFLRSGTQLIPLTKRNVYKFVKEGGEEDEFSLDAKDAKALYDLALENLGDMIDPTLNIRLTATAEVNKAHARTHTGVGFPSKTKARKAKAKANGDGK